VTLRNPPFPEDQPSHFQSTVHGTVFAGRERDTAALHDGTEQRLIADSPVQDQPEVWAHLALGDPIGHLLV
jgi:hypothetical protein